MSALEIRIARAGKFGGIRNRLLRGCTTRAALNRREGEKSVGFEFLGPNRHPPLSVLLNEALVLAAEEKQDVALNLQYGNALPEEDAGDPEDDAPEVWSSGFDTDPAPVHGHFTVTGAYYMQDDADDDSPRTPEEIAEEDEAARSEDVFYGDGYMFLKNSCGCQKASLDPDREINAISWRLN